MNVLIIGGAGYVGAGLVEELNRPGTKISKIRIYDNLSRGNYNLFLTGKFKHSNLELVQGDILDARSLKKAVAGMDVVYHLAARVTTPFANLDPHMYEQVNHWGTADVVAAIEDSEVAQLIYLSSTSVYGASQVAANENTPPNPKTFYGVSKWRGEQHVQRLVAQGRAFIIRSGNVYGFSPSMRFDAVINRFAFEANFLKKISIQGNGKQSRAFVHINALAKVLVQLPQSNLPSGTYNLAQRNTTILDLVDVFKQLVPELEFIFVDQHMELRNFELELDLKLAKYLSLPQVPALKSELAEFLDRFSF